MRKYLEIWKPSEMMIFLALLLQFKVLNSQTAIDVNSLLIFILR